MQRLGVPAHTDVDLESEVEVRGILTSAAKTLSDWTHEAHASGWMNSVTSVLWDRVLLVQ